MPIDPIERADQPPEIIYLQWTAQELMHAEPVNELDVTWCSDKICAEDTEYVRADVAEQRVVEAEKERDEARAKYDYIMEPGRVGARHAALAKLAEPVGWRWTTSRPVESFIRARIEAAEQQSAQLRSALERIGSMEAFEIGGFVDKTSKYWPELEARMDFARKALEPTGEPNEQR